MKHWIRITMARDALAVVMALVGIATFAAPALAQTDGMEPAREISTNTADRTGDFAPLAVVGTAFTYQGHLLSGGIPSDGPYDLQFRLFDAAAGGTQIGSTLSLDNLAVTDGRFTASLDFGQGAFGGGARWLDIAVRPGAGGIYTILTPRQKLDAAPYALGMPNVYTNESNNFVGIGRNFQVSSTEAFGVRAMAAANQYGGMHVDVSDAGGWPFYGYATNGFFRAWTYYDGTTSIWKLYNGGDRLSVPFGGGLEIHNVSSGDGLRINDTGDDGIQIGTNAESPNYGVYIPSPGVANYGLWSNTAAASGNYALYTLDNIEAGVVTLSAQTIVAKVSGAGDLGVGDVVAADGVTDPVPGATNRLALVRLAGRDATGLVGVVAARMEWQPAKGKEAEGEMVLMPADGPAGVGDYVSLVVLGVADVRVDRGAVIAKGTRLTAADAGGRARALRTESLNGMLVSEGAPVVGVALEDSRGRDTVPVFVNLR
ncbi:MAG: hypothetical protein Q7W56_12145 [Candidatus Latescibacteria bacterium]|nr:hypothetical protein [Candidatus Latescibacterota bacterium]